MGDNNNATDEVHDSGKILLSDACKICPLRSKFPPSYSWARSKESLLDVKVARSKVYQSCVAYPFVILGFHLFLTYTIFQEYESRGRIILAPTSRDMLVYYFALASGTAAFYANRFVSIICVRRLGGGRCKKCSYWIKYSVWGSCLFFIIAFLLWVLFLSTEKSVVLD
jgi:hypothetical protein